jgi:hypothetical protein
MLMSVSAPLLKADAPGLAHKAEHQLAKQEKKVEKALDKLAKKLDVNVLGQILDVQIPKLTDNLAIDQATGNLVGTVNATVKTALGSTVVPIDVELERPAAANSDGVAAAATVPILHLTINPIHLNVLGLHVDTSPICLNLDADPAGGLLGSLLAGLSGLLNGPALDLGAITGAINQITTQAGHLVGLGNLTLTGGGTTVTTPFTANFGNLLPGGGGIVTVLHLSLGPVNLNLLGLHVKLDNCANGPVVVDVTADPHGGLLGSLLAGLLG